MRKENSTPRVRTTREKLANIAFLLFALIATLSVVMGFLENPSSPEWFKRLDLVLMWLAVIPLFVETILEDQENLVIILLVYIFVSTIFTISELHLGNLLIISRI